MLELRNDSLVFSFPEVHSDAVCEINFQRTLRIPDDAQEYPLPPGLGRFPLRHTDDFAEKLPGSWAAHGGVFLPMYQAEALWISFQSCYPFAIKIAAGKINALTGEAWSDGLSSSGQDYLVIPDQPWLDGFCVSKGVVRQFVAMPLGEGYTAEEQITGNAQHGGLQIIAYAMKGDRYESWKRRYAKPINALYDMGPQSEMGLAPGGLMKQQIYQDRHGLDAWHASATSRCFVHILNSAQYLAATGTKPPTNPPTAKQYVEAGLPWFTYFDHDARELDGAAVLKALKSISLVSQEKTGLPIAENESLAIKHLIALGKDLEP